MSHTLGSFISNLFLPSSNSIKWHNPKAYNESIVLTSITIFINLGFSGLGHEGVR